VEIRNFFHKGLKRLFEDDNPKGCPPASVDKIRKMLTFLMAMEEAVELETIPIWKAHRLTWRSQCHLEPQCHSELAADLLGE
jgi:proteic killer suppression protein